MGALVLLADVSSLTNRSVQAERHESEAGRLEGGSEVHAVQRKSHEIKGRI